MASKKVAFFATGHRPDKVGGYSTDALKRLIAFFEIQLKPLKKEIKIMNVGMAQGVDTAVAIACIRLKIPIRACIPCDNQEKIWPEEAQARYRKILEKAAETVIVNPGEYAGWKMHARNEYMVDNSEKGVCLHNGTSGGTWSCLYYSNYKKVPVMNLWKEWQEFKHAN
jgi:uncharacterized phage-like protein YoqJ